MFLFSHPLTALIMATLALINLSALGIKFSALTSGSSEEKMPDSVLETKQPLEERQMVTVAQ